MKTIRSARRPADRSLRIEGFSRRASGQVLPGPGGMLSENEDVLASGMALLPAAETRSGVSEEPTRETEGLSAPALPASPPRRKSPPLRRPSPGLRRRSPGKWRSSPDGRDSLPHRGGCLPIPGGLHRRPGGALRKAEAPLRGGGDGLAPAAAPLHRTIAFKPGT